MHLKCTWNSDAFIMYHNKLEYHLEICLKYLDRALFSVESGCNASISCLIHTQTHAFMHRVKTLEVLPVILYLYQNEIKTNW